MISAPGDKNFVTRGDLKLSQPLSDTKGWLSLYRSRSLQNATPNPQNFTLINLVLPEFDIGVIRFYSAGNIGGNSRLARVNIFVDGEQIPQSQKLQGADYSASPEILVPILKQLRSGARIFTRATIQPGFSGIVYSKLEGWYY
jgi:hypothetical protein